MYFSCPAAKVSLINHNEIKLLFHLRCWQINRFAILRIRRKGINSLIIYLWHAKKVLDYCLPYLCVCDRYSRFILSRKCQMHNEYNSQFWCNWQAKKGCCGGGCRGSCLPGACSGASGSKMGGHIIKCQTLFGAALVCRNLGNIWTKCFLIWQAIWPWHATSDCCNRTATAESNLICKSALIRLCLCVPVCVCVDLHNN